MNNKGFMRTLEAIVAILIIFGFILFIFPKAERFEGYIPVELDRMSTAMMTEIQNEDSFRKAVLSPEQLIEYKPQDSMNYESKSGFLIIDEFIKSSLPPLSPWTYAFIICDINNDMACKGYNPIYKENQLITVRDEFEQHLPTDKSIFTKRLFVSVDDVTALPVNPGNPIAYKEFKIYFWQK